MVPNSIFLILVSSIFHAFWNILTQTSNNAQFFSGLKGIWIIALAAAYFLITVYPSRISLELYYWALLSGLFHGFYILSLSRAYNTQDISYVYPIARSAPVFVPFFAWLLLGERLSPIIFLAIGIIVIAIYILHFEGRLVQGFKKLFQAIAHNDLRWSFITLALVVIYSLVDKRAMDMFILHFPNQPFANGITFFFLEATVGFTLCNGYLFVKHSPYEIMKTWKKEWCKGLLAAIATLISYGLICVVLQFEPLSPIVSLRQVSVLLVVYWGCWKLGEPYGRQRLSAGFLIIMAIMVISIGGGKG